MVAKTIDPGLAARLRKESEQTKEAKFPNGAVPTRPNRLRTKVYSVRLSAEEQARVQRVADAKHLPVRLNRMPPDHADGTASDAATTGSPAGSSFGSSSRLSATVEECTFFVGHRR